MLKTIIRERGTVVNQPWSFYERHFGDARLNYYVSEMSGDEPKAKLLYQWNVEVASAFWGSLAHLEVALRNTIDARMTLRHANLERDGHWIFDDHYEFGRKESSDKHKQPYKDVAIAKGRVTKNQKLITPGQVISEISFGFWHQMVSKSQMRFWPDLAGGFPHSPDRTQDTIREPVSRLRDLRNRIGRHHRIWSEDLQAHYVDLLNVVGYIDPDLRSWVEFHSAVPAVLNRRPDKVRPSS